MLTHFLELRRRILLVLCGYTGVFAIFFCLAPNLFTQLMHPLLDVLLDHEDLIATQITAPIFIPIKAAADAAFLTITPFALYQIWQFVMPGLYRREQIHLRWLFIGSVILFFLGMLFCFYIALPLMLKCFAHSVPTGVRLMPDMAYSFDFITRMLWLFGLSFQLPLISTLLIFLGVVEVSALQAFRPYAMVISFILGMILTPPDVLSQILVAVPLCILYEFSILLAKMLPLKSKENES